MSDEFVEEKEVVRAPGQPAEDRGAEDDPGADLPDDPRQPEPLEPVAEEVRRDDQDHEGTGETGSGSAHPSMMSFNRPSCGRTCPALLRRRRRPTFNGRCVTCGAARRGHRGCADRRSRARSRGHLRLSLSLQARPAVKTARSARRARRAFEGLGEVSRHLAGADQPVDLLPEAPRPGARQLREADELAIRLSRAADPSTRAPRGPPRGRPSRPPRRTSSLRSTASATSPSAASRSSRTVGRR